VLLAVTGCGTSGRELREAEPGATAPPRSTSTTVTAVVTPPSSETLPPAVFALSSPDFDPAGPLPMAVTCDGDESAPRLEWASPPTDATELALVVVDLDDDRYVHWLVTGIPPGPGGLDGTVLPDGSTERANSSGESDWVAPCPEEGRPHTYDFTLHALTDPVALDDLDDLDADEAVEVVEAASTARTGLTASSER
jgi:phosphatidylethanolamine-binding protein (PEBP) family uncharacterized protein